MAKGLGWTLIILSVIAGIIMIISGVFAQYNYNKYFFSYWSLSDKSSSLDAKSLYISEFVDKINASRQGFADYDAIFLKTPDNSFDKNFGALVSLRDRLHSISQMNESDFAYQTAIQQITAQEQGEADAMLQVFSGCYYLQNYPLLWDWIGMSVGIILTLIFMVGCFLVKND
jgi:hypothetical protein